MNRCSRCGFEITREGARFCPRCGEALPSKEAERPGDSPKEVLFQAPALPGRRVPWIISAFLIIIILLAGGVFAWVYFQGYFLDTTPPQVMITSPADDKEVVLLPEKPAQENIEIAAGDNRRLERVELFLNGVLVKKFEKGEPFIYKWSTSEEGKYAFQAFAYDNCGNKSNSSPVVITATKEETVGGEQIFSYEDKEIAEQEVALVIAKWIRTAEEKDLYGQVDCYAEYVDQYFQKYNVPKSEIIKDKEAMMMIKYDTIDIEVSDPQINIESNDRATASFIKKWDAKGNETFSGEERQRLELRKFDNEWKITREEEVEIYWVIKNGKRII